MSKSHISFFNFTYICIALNSNLTQSHTNDNYVSCIGTNFITQQMFQMLHVLFQHYKNFFLSQTRILSPFVLITLILCHFFKLSFPSFKAKLCHNVHKNVLKSLSFRIILAKERVYFMGNLFFFANDTLYVNQCCKVPEVMLSIIVQAMSISIQLLTIKRKIVFFSFI